MVQQNGLKWIDAHCHLTDLRLRPVLRDVIQESIQLGVDYFIQGGVSPAEWEEQLKINEQFPGRIGLVFGLHPWWVHDQVANCIKNHGDSAEAEDLIELALTRLRSHFKLGTARPLAVGEAGLDFSRDRMKVSVSQQLSCFQEQLELAMQIDRPIVLHVVRAHPQALGLLKSRKGRVTGIVHSFSGSSDDARSYVELGFKLSIGTRVLGEEGKPPSASTQELFKIIKDLSKEQLVLETDSPDQPPRNLMKQETHTPTSLLLIAKKISEIRGVPVNEVLDQSAKNLIELFKIQQL